MDTEPDFFSWMDTLLNMMGWKTKCISFDSSPDSSPWLFWARFQFQGGMNFTFLEDSGLGNPALKQGSFPTKRSVIYWFQEYIGWNFLHLGFQCKSQLPPPLRCLQENLENIIVEPSEQWGGQMPCFRTWFFMVFWSNFDDDRCKHPYIMPEFVRWHLNFCLELAMSSLQKMGRWTHASRHSRKSDQLRWGSLVLVAKKPNKIPTFTIKINHSCR